MMMELLWPAWVSSTATVAAQSSGMDPDRKLPHTPSAPLRTYGGAGWGTKQKGTFLWYLRSSGLELIKTHRRNQSLLWRNLKTGFRFGLIEVCVEPFALLLRALTIPRIRLKVCFVWYCWSTHWLIQIPPTRLLSQRLWPTRTCSTVVLFNTVCSMKARS